MYESSGGVDNLLLCKIMSKVSGGDFFIFPENSRYFYDDIILVIGCNVRK